jgi:ubiquinone/menaquinone biosynthesis C-methylase UbiE
MATILRDLSYKYQWLYDNISRLAALSVGGEGRFRRLPLQNLTILKTTQILDLCCGSGQATSVLLQYSDCVTGLDASPLSLARAKKNVPQAEYVEAWAENMPFAENSFDIVHTSAALHEMNHEQLKEILREVYRVLKPGGIFAIADFHPPTNPIFWTGVAVFFFLFETETAWELMKTDLTELLTETGFKIERKMLFAGGSLQVIHGKK